MHFSQSFFWVFVLFWRLVSSYPIIPRGNKPWTQLSDMTDWVSDPTLQWEDGRALVSRHHPMKNGNGPGGSSARGSGAAPGIRWARPVRARERGSWGSRGAGPAQHTLSAARTAGRPLQDWTGETSGLEDYWPTERELGETQKEDENWNYTGMNREREAKNRTRNLGSIQILTFTQMIIFSYDPLVI